MIRDIVSEFHCDLLALTQQYQERFKGVDHPVAAEFHCDLGPTLHCQENVLMGAYRIALEAVLPRSRNHSIWI